MGLSYRSVRYRRETWNCNNRLYQCFSWSVHIDTLISTLTQWSQRSVWVCMCVCVYLVSNFSRLVEGLKVYIDIFLSIKVFGKFHLLFIFYFYIIVIYISYNFIYSNNSEDKALWITKQFNRGITLVESLEHVRISKDCSTSGFWRK